MLRRCDLVSDSRQNKNAGNSGDLVKHSSYLALLHQMVSHPAWSDEIHITEAHAGKGVYAATSAHLRTACTIPGYRTSPLGVAQAVAFSKPPEGLGEILDLQPNELPYAGSAVIHGLELRRLRSRNLTLMDHDGAVRATVDRVYQEPALASLSSDVHLVDPGRSSEPLVLASLRRGEYSPADVVHFDPFAFVMDRDDDKRRMYNELITACDDRVRSGDLGAATLFITWGSNNRAALDDLRGEGYQGGLEGGYLDLVQSIEPAQRIVVTWCWELYFSRCSSLSLAGSEQNSVRH